MHGKDLRRFSPEELMAKYPTSYRLSQECLILIEQLSAHLGITGTGVIEQAVRKMARAEMPDAPAPTKPAAKPRKEK
jgi:hypothetical protein